MRTGRPRAIRTVLALVAAVSALLTAAAPAPAAFPGYNGKIAYNDSGTGIFRINPDGSNNELVKGGGVRNAVWSSDGTKIAYVSGQSIRITAADGTGSTLVCSACAQSFQVNQAAMTWSPDGTQFAFTRAITANDFHVYRINADGTGETQLTFVGNNRHPAWSPDGTRIAFWSSRSSGIWVMNADGTGQTGIGGLAEGDRPSWSPDGAKLAFTRNGGIWTMNADGSNQTQITAESPEGVGDRNPAWSPDGQQIAFRGWTATPFNDGLTVVNVDGTGRTSLGTPGRLPDWQPISPGYVRPKGATPFVVSLVPAYESCAAPNETHGPPFAVGSCNPPQRSSSFLTVGTPDANGKPATSTGSVRADVIAGNPATQADEADLQLRLDITDVRVATDLSDYAGELSAHFVVRRTDRESQPFNSTPATVVDHTLSFDAPCVTDPGVPGSTCSAQTSADAILPGTVQEGRRAIWELGQAQVFDGGPDGDTGTNDNTLFAVGGVFVP